MIDFFLTVHLTCTDKSVTYLDHGKPGMDPGLQEWIFDQLDCTEAEKPGKACSPTGVWYGVSGCGFNSNVCLE